jgi:DNA mismatch repair protein MutS
MTNSFSRIKNFNVSVKEINKQIIFLRKLKEGGSEHSFGIHVAKVAGMPKSILDKANEMLEKMENSKSRNNMNKTLENKKDMQLSFFQLDDPILSKIKEEITKIDINSLTPLEALMKLNEIKKILG